MQALSTYASRCLGGTSWGCLLLIYVEGPVVFDQLGFLGGDLQLVWDSFLGLEVYCLG